ncbi:SipW-dependent-type signal peptide-containing protein [Halobium salinum]|uniref:SipW-dependent-type signal peptide-containing protein n=1 Tax=Halobium salinum TaxID=1364940 RepID=A0ABD5PB14_9EURY|nr:SipW-dependent-type signal peptide-containing protein [Halobium salinum]
MADDNLNISRRSVLAGLGTIGIASAGAGLGTSAYFNDTEEFDGNTLTAGELDLLVGYKAYYFGAKNGRGSRHEFAKVKNGDEGDLSANLSDIKPGDALAAEFCFKIRNNPAYLWMCGELTADDENGRNEPEKHVDDSAHDGELAERMMARVAYTKGHGTDGYQGPHSVGDVSYYHDSVDDSLLVEGTLREVLDALRMGIPLDGDGDVTPPKKNRNCFDKAGDGDEYADAHVVVETWLPASVGNEVQSDSVEFDLKFYAEQCRHNDGADNPCVNVTTKRGRGWPFTTDKWSPQAIAGSRGATELRFESPDGLETQDLNTNYGYASPSEWFYNTGYDFELTFDGDDEATMTVYHDDGSTSITNTVPGAGDKLGLVAKSSDDFDFEIREVTVDDGIDSGPTSVMAPAENGDDKKHLLVEGATLGDGFTVTGTFEFVNDSKSGRVEQVGNYGMNILVKY